MAFTLTIKRVVLALSLFSTLLLPWYILSTSSPKADVGFFEDPGTTNDILASVLSMRPPESDVPLDVSEDPATTNEVVVSFLYHEAGVDRSGSIIFDMLMVHAYAYQNNWTYGGACFSDPTAEKMQYVPVHEALIEMMGLSHVLQFSCPSDAASIKSLWVERSTYLSFGTRIWTSEWLEHIRSFQSPPPSAVNTSSRAQMVVHIRRGDVDLCNPDLEFRYLPNSHYQHLIQEFSDKDMEVLVYSESKSTEPWKDDYFRSLIDHLYLDASVVEAWKAMITADVFIMSASGFSFVPALFNRRGLIVYSPFWEMPLPHWHVVDEDTMQHMRESKAQLEREIC